MSKANLYIGTAGWNIPKNVRDTFFAKGAVKPNHLKAYAEHFRGVEINSSFHREHQGSTYAKWAAATPEDFRFSIKLFKKFTHEQKLKVDSSELESIMNGIFGLGEKLGVVLVQLPPKLEYAGEVAEEFFAVLRELYTGDVALEPRHVSWTEREATRLLEDYQIARVTADPTRLGLAPPIRSTSLAYFRLHGSPRTYKQERRGSLARAAQSVKPAPDAHCSNPHCLGAGLPFPLEQKQL